MRRKLNGEAPKIFFIYDQTRVAFLSVFFYLCLHQIWRGTGVFLIYMYTYKIKFYNKNNEWRQSQRTV